MGSIKVPPQQHPPPPNNPHNTALYNMHTYQDPRTDLAQSRGGVVKWMHHSSTSNDTGSLSARPVRVPKIMNN